MDTCSLANDFLCKHSLFGGLTNPELDIIRPFIQEFEYKEGTHILKQGEFNSRVYFIVKGIVSIEKYPEHHEKESRKIVTLVEGDSFGEMELIDIQPCAASAIALTDTSIVSLDNRDFYQLSKTHLKIYTMMMLNLARDISRRLRRTDELLAEATMKSKDTYVL
ncbi:MAG: Crp/Fnr family transcriptional regulator [Spirochaetia bacterium]|nr:Crp/Fnr family transcriptional regulator [Spirochaetia bacterium]